MGVKVIHDPEHGRLVETRVADPGGRWVRAADVHAALMAHGMDVLTVEHGLGPDGTDEVRVLAKTAATDALTALPAPGTPRSRDAQLAEKIAAATTLDELKRVLVEDLGA